MQTFAPFAEFKKSAYVLDKKRVWKQVVECKQLLCSLRADNLPYDWIDTNSYKKQSYKNHPARLMWIGYEEALKQYFNDFLEVSKCIHKINTTMKPLYVDVNKIELPWWLGNEDFHRAMRSRLIEKNPEFYLPLFPDDKGFNEGKYFWPDMTTKRFKTI